MNRHGDGDPAAGGALPAPGLAKPKPAGHLSQYRWDAPVTLSHISGQSPQFGFPQNQTVRPMSDRVYLDVCCLNRPFDDQSQPRIRMESEAVVLILQAADAGELELVSSDAIDLELLRHPSAEIREGILASVRRMSRRLTGSPAVTERARRLHGLGFGPMDALHLAFAEKAGADVLLTTDDGLLRLAGRLESMLKIRVLNPVRWVQERYP